MEHLGSLGVAHCNTCSNTAIRTATPFSTWFKITLWGKQAEVANQYLSKGKQVYIEGRLRTETWTDKEGKERFSLRVRASTMQLLGSPGDTSRWMPK